MNFNNQRYYLHNNHRGDVIAMRDGTTTAGAYTYSAFGTLLGSTGTDVCRFKFSSKERDPSTGFIYYGYRFYAPQWQRWMNADPLRDLRDSNVHRFVGNSPGSRVDLRGLTAAPLQTLLALWQAARCGAEVAYQISIVLGNLGVPGLPQADDDDSLQHCISSCRLARACGSLTAWALGQLKETNDLLHGGTANSTDKDLEANEHGRAGKCLKQSCEDYCNKTRDEYR